MASSTILRQQHPRRMTESVTLHRRWGRQLIVYGDPESVESGRRSRAGAIPLSVNKERGNDEHTRGEASIDGLRFPPQTGCCSVRRSLDVSQAIGWASSHRQAQCRWGYSRCGACTVLTNALIGRN
jgi:hypothetical protein